MTSRTPGHGTDQTQAGVGANPAAPPGGRARHARWMFLLAACFLGVTLGTDGAPGWAADAVPAPPFDFETASRNVPKPRELWPIVRQHCVPLEFRVQTDDVVVSDTDPGTRLRRVTAHFWSQELAGRKWGHPCTILLPADPARNEAPDRRGKVVIISSP